MNSTTDLSNNNNNKINCNTKSREHFDLLWLRLVRWVSIVAGFLISLQFFFSFRCCFSFCRMLLCKKWFFCPRWWSGKTDKYRIAIVCEPTINQTLFALLVTLFFFSFTPHHLRCNVLDFHVRHVKRLIWLRKLKPYITIVFGWKGELTKNMVKDSFVVKRAMEIVDSLNERKKRNLSTKSCSWLSYARNIIYITDNSFGYFAPTGKQYVKWKH